MIGGLVLVLVGLGVAVGGAYLERHRVPGVRRWRPPAAPPWIGAEILAESGGYEPRPEPSQDARERLRAAVAGVGVLPPLSAEQLRDLHDELRQLIGGPT